MSSLDWMDSEWRPVVGLPGYQVSPDGRLLGPKCERKLRLTEDGYHAVSIRRKTYRIHVLVCAAYRGPRPSPDHEVRHLNGVRIDNRVENLAWGTRAENAADKRRHGTDANASKTKCSKGHPYNEENTYIRPGSRPGRNCKQCHRESNRAYMRTYIHPRKRAS